MQTMTEIQLDGICGGGDSLGKDIGQFLGGTFGWIQANFGFYILLGPGVGTVTAAHAGIRNASL